MPSRMKKTGMLLPTARAEPEVDHVWYAQHRPDRRIRLSGRVPAC